uniref:BTB domain-containing protein n=1 Tax=Panagrolaimus davidi TaxID=227884 RepID=A0A914Q2H7_9BILA
MSLDTGPFYPDSKDILSKDYAYKMQQERFEIFKSQDPDNGHFDITFEIEGKKLYANKFILTPCSETLKAMLSDRWSNKDESVKIEAYSYDNFYQFLTFLYTGSCKLTRENVFQLTDMAEFYAVPFLKEFCEKFLLGMNYYVQNIEEMFEFAQKYSMEHMEDLIKKFVSSNFEAIISSESLLSYKKPFMDVLASIIHYPWKGKIFEAIYKWVEHQVITQKDVEDESFNLLETVKTEFPVKDELRETFPHIYSLDKTKMSKYFLIDFMFEKGILLSPGEFRSIYQRIRRTWDGEFCFKYVYDLAEKQALQKQKMNPNNSFNLADSVKILLSEVIPNVEFCKMNKTFVMDFIVPKGILTEEQANHLFDIRVSIENNRKTVTGVFKNDILAVSHKVTCLKQTSTNMCRFLKLKFPIPSIKSSIKKMKGVDWYLCLDKNGILTLKHHSKIKRSDYLIVEMKSESEFSLTPNKITIISISFNNLNLIT